MVPLLRRPSTYIQRHPVQGGWNYVTFALEDGLRMLSRPEMLFLERTDVRQPGRPPRHHELMALGAGGHSQQCPFYDPTAASAPAGFDTWTLAVLRPLRWGIAGCGKLAEDFAATLSLVPGTQLVACCDPIDLGRAEVGGSPG